LAAVDRIRRFIAAAHPDMAEPLADYVVTLMTGLSAMAREGHGPERLRATARLGAAAIARAISA
jgi:TetR/AcrR family transcriptional repressor for divergent bdcA